MRKHYIDKERFEVVKYSVVYEESNTMPVDPRTIKILVFGAISGQKKDYQAL